MPQEIPPPRIFEDVFDYASDNDPSFVSCSDLDGLEGEDIHNTEPEPDLVNPPIQEATRQASNTRNQGRSLLPKVQAVCKLLTELDLNIGDFLHALSWGDPECTANAVVCYHRTVLFQNDLLLHTLQDWNKPPNINNHRGSEIMKTFAVACVMEQAQEEMKTISRHFQSGPDPLSLASLTSFNFSETATDS